MITIRQFSQAIVDRNLRLVKQYIEEGGDINVINDYKWTALMYASYGGYTEVVEYLIGAGADMNIQRPSGSTALMSASENGHIEVVKYLIEVGVDTNIQDSDGYTALMYASQYGHLEVVKILEDPNEYILYKKLNTKSDIIKNSSIF